MVEAISYSEINKAVDSVLRIGDVFQTFSIPHAVTTQLTEYSVNFDLRNPLVDFPRLAEDVIGQLLYWCDQIVKQSSDFTQTINLILEAKKNPETPLAKLSEILSSMGISWDVKIANGVPTVYINPTEYYIRYWRVKLRDFVDRLNTGEDYPETIYERASMLTPSYNVSHFANGAQVFKPGVFNLLERSGLDVVFEFDSLVSSVGAIQRNVLSFPVEYLPQIEFIGIINSALVDMRVTIDQLYLLEAHGHFSPGFILLRKLLADMGMVLFFRSFAEEYPRIDPKSHEKRLSEELEVKALEFGISTWQKEFKRNWFKVYRMGIPYILEEEVDKAENIDETMNIKTLSYLAKLYRNGELERFYCTEKIREVQKKKKNKNTEYPSIEFSDTVYIDSIDIFLQNTMLVFDAINAGIELPSRKEKLKNPEMYRVYVEYHKLSDAIHSPMLVDFPPYSSTIEYLGFLHHLRIVRKIFSDVAEKLKSIV